MPANGSLKKILTRQNLRQLAGDRSFERGEEYFARQQVDILVDHAGRLTAIVHGSDEYHVTLSPANNADPNLDYNCSCPMGQDGNFCKHCVAVSLAWLAHGAPASSGKKKAQSTTPVVILEDAQAWLLKQNQGKLIEIILNQAAQDQSLREHLLLQSAKAA